MRELIWIAAGGAVGAVLRYLIAGKINDASESLPWGTLTVNVLGSFLLGVIVALPEEKMSPEIRKAIAVGILGALTTFSTFAVETLTKWNDRWTLGTLNIVANVTCALLSAYCGRTLIMWWSGSELAG